VTLDDVSCLLHLPIDGVLMSYEFISRDDAVDLMIRYLGSDPSDALKEMTNTRGEHAMFSCLTKIFKQCLLWQLELFNEGGMDEEVQRLRDQALRIYLLYLVGIMLFTDKIGTYVDVVYLRHFRDLEVVAGFSWELRAYLTCIESLTMLPIGPAVSCQGTCLCCRYKLIIMFVFSFVSFNLVYIFICGCLCCRLGFIRV